MQTTPITSYQNVSWNSEEHNAWATGTGSKNNTRRIISLCVLLVVSFVASVFPAFAKRSSYLRTPRVVFFIGKYFGTGVILATAFIHLLKDAFQNMSKARVNERWGKYESWPGLLIMCSLLFIFLVEYISTVYVEYLTEQSVPTRPSTPEEENNPAAPKRPGLEHVHTDCLHGEVSLAHGEANKVVGVFVSIIPEMKESLDADGCLGLPFLPITKVLQLGIMLHSIVVGFTLSVTNGSEFTSLLIALIFHQLFEGLSLGVRISSLRPTLFVSPTSSPGTEAAPLLPSSHRSKSKKAFPTLPLLLASLFALATPAGMLVGILLRTAPQDAFLVRGIASAVSAGLLIYASCVELLAGDFVADPKMRKAGLKRQAVALGSLLAGAAGMAVIGIWS